MKHVCSFVLRHSLLVAVLFFAFGKTARAQAPAWQGAVVSSGASFRAAAADASGNVYVVGSFNGTVVLGTLALVSAGSTDAFVAKWSTVTNGFVWAHRAGGVGSDEALAMAVSGSSVYVTGLFSGTAAFGPISLTSAGQTDLFVTKLTDAGAAGSFAWAQRAGGAAGSARPYAIGVSGANVYITGEFLGTFSLGAAGNLTTTSTGNSDGFLAKLTDAGGTAGFTWAQRLGGSGIDGCSGLAVNGSSVYVTGEFSGTAVLGTLGLVSVGNFDVFVAKLTDTGPTGSFVWAQRAGGVGFDYSNALAVNGGSVYVTGSFNGTAGFGATTLASNGAEDLYVAKLMDAGTAGSFTWAQRGGGGGSDGGSGLAVSGPNVYVTGHFVGVAALGTLGLVSAGSLDVFVAKLTDAGSTGSFVWAQSAGGTSYDVGVGVAVSGASVFVAGQVTLPTSFGSFTFATPAGNTGGALASLRDPALSATASPLLLAAIGLFPNPARTAATVRLPAVPGAATATLTLLDALGRAVRTQLVPLPAAGATVELALAGLAPGLYRLRVQAGGQQTSQALAVE